MSGKFWAWAGGIAASVIGAAIIADLGIGEKMSVTINGPTTAPFGTGIAFRLNGHVNGSFENAYWTDTFGQRIALTTYGQQLFYCPSMGSFTITLTAMSGDKHEQASHTVICVRG